jgi:hypothetical protein
MSRQPFMVLMILLGGLAIAAHQESASFNPAIAQVSDRGAVPGSGDALPDSVKEAVLQAASVQTGLKPEQLTLTQATSKVWSDGCLGLAPPEQMCTAVLVQGWEVRVAHQRQEWVYRTKEAVSVVWLLQQQNKFPVIEWHKNGIRRSHFGLLRREDLLE